MKVLIWIGCFIVATILNVILGEVTGLKVGYFLFYLAVFSVAKKLCGKWDEYKEKKTEKEIAKITADIPSVSTWKCSCGKIHREYETSCVCGKTKAENTSCLKTEKADISSTNEPILFCRKCGEKLIDNSQFCRKCGTMISKE